MMSVSVNLRSNYTVYYTVLFIFLSPPRFLLEIRVIIKILKKILVSHKLWLIWIRMKQKKFFFWKKKYKMAHSKKLSFSKSPILKMNWSLDSRIDWCQGSWCSSTYMVVRLSNVGQKQPKNTKNAFFACFWA